MRRERDCQRRFALEARGWEVTKYKYFVTVQKKIIQVSVLCPSICCI